MCVCVFADPDHTDSMLGGKYDNAQRAGQGQQRAGSGSVGHPYTVLPNGMGHGLPSAHTTPTEGVCLSAGCVKAGKSALLVSPGSLLSLRHSHQYVWMCVRSYERVPIGQLSKATVRH